MRKKFYPIAAVPILLSFTFLTCVKPVLANPAPYTTAYQNAAASTPVSVSEADAVRQALDLAGVKEKDIVLLKAKLDYDHDGAEYEIEFYVGNTKYEYEINAATGAVIKSSAAVDYAVRNGSQPVSTSAPSGAISEADAVADALFHADVDKNSVYFLEIELDYDHGRPSDYEIEFYAGNTKYEYEIDASTGAVLKYGSSADLDIRIPVMKETGSTDANPSGPLSEEDAKRAALGRVRGATDKNIRLWTEYDDGKKTYEGKIVYNEIEYDFEIDPATGKFLEWESESVYD